jgi:hypothetical protein
VIGGAVRPSALAGRGRAFFPSGVAAWPQRRGRPRDQDEIRVGRHAFCEGHNFCKSHNFCESNVMKIATDRLERAVPKRGRTHFDPSPFSACDAEALKARGVAPAQRRPSNAVNVVAVRRRSVRGQGRGGAAPTQCGSKILAPRSGATSKAKRLKRAS